MKIIYTNNHRQHDPNGSDSQGQRYKTTEIPQRAEVIMAALQAAQLWQVIAPEDFGMRPILAVHTQDFINLLSGNGVDSPIPPGAWQAAYWSAMCALAGAKILEEGEHTAFVVCRPPGHHATRDSHGGFCYLNNAAIAARRLQPRVAILDIDYHHGNGTQEIFYDDPNVLFCSIHAHPEDSQPPALGFPHERGIGPGRGYNANWILPKMTGDDEYLITLERVLARICDFKPRYLIVSAGFDTTADDHVGGFMLSQVGIQSIGARIANLKLPTLIILEGGYQIQTLGANVVAFLKEFE
jgi:acetoin utilization deacetylase AcuC-like enzyme